MKKKGAVASKKNVAYEPTKVGLLVAVVAAITLILISLAVAYIR